MGIIKNVLGTVGEVIRGPQPLDAQNRPGDYQNGGYQNDPSQNGRYYNNNNTNDAYYNDGSGSRRQRRHTRRIERRARRADQFSEQNSYGRPGPAPMMQPPMMQQPMNAGLYRGGYDERLGPHSMAQQPMNDASYRRSCDERLAGYGMMQQPMNPAPCRRSYDERLGPYPMAQQPANDAPYRRSFDGRSVAYPWGLQGTASIAQLPAEDPRPAAGSRRAMSQESWLGDEAPPAYEQVISRP